VAIYSLFHYQNHSIQQRNFSNYGRYTKRELSCWAKAIDLFQKRMLGSLGKNTGSKNDKNY
tara:strand:- start:299 stop:481 length:183 start_codon:yes stop_codon:yes gene_type:complete